MNKYATLLILIFLSFSAYSQCSQIDAGDDLTVDCSNNCTSLSATVFPGIGSATNTYYIMEATPCPLPPSGNITPTGITVDDRWSPIINLPFTFYFFGQAYTQILIGANGVISFDTNRTSPEVQQPNQYCAWQFNESLPSTNLFRNTIFGAYHDVDVSVPNGGIIEYYVSGTAPQRKFVVSYVNVAHYHCNSLHTTQRIVLYETSNIIDVQIDHKDTCTSWNNGNALIGIQNEDGTLAYVPPGRNTGAWTIPASDPELWRFVPNYNPQQISFNFNWYNNNTNTLVGSNQSINVCVTEDTEFKVEAEFDDPNTGQHYILRDTINVFFQNTLGQPDLGNDIQECSGNTVHLDGTTAGAVSYQWQENGVDIPGATNPTLDITGTQTATYTVIVTNGVCENSDDIVVQIEATPDIDIGPDFHECEGNIATITATVNNQTGNETYQWQKDGIDIPGATNSTLDVTETGEYTVLVTNSIGCTGTDSVIVTFDEFPELELGSDQIICPYELPFELASNITDADTYQWEINGSISSDTSGIYTFDTPGEYDVTLNITRGTCSTYDTVHITILEPVTITETPILYGKLEVEAQGGLPPYEYAIDDINFQKEGYFENLPDGEYIINVKDANGCIYEFPPIYVINLVFPKFITPNGDGFNDTWRVENAENTPTAIIDIYDRYGKLVKHMTTHKFESWDGTYNGKPLIASDYWYLLTLPDGKIYKGHFSVKR
jgi:gliding motility-associated-like protein